MLGARGSSSAKLLSAAREAIAHPLELTEVEQTRTMDRHRDIRVAYGGDIGECARHDARELLLEPGDLVLQRPPRAALRNGDTRPIANKVGVRRDTLVSIEHPRDFGGPSID